MPVAAKNTSFNYISPTKQFLKNDLRWIIDQLPFKQVSNLSLISKYIFFKVWSVQTTLCQGDLQALMG